MKRIDYPLIRKFLFLAVLMLIGITAHAQFSGYYDPANWVVTNDPSGTGGSIDPSAAPASVTIVSGNSGVEGVTQMVITMPASGTVSFNWSYSTTDGPQYDYPRYVLNGAIITVSGYSTSGSSIQSGTASIPVNGGDVFGILMYTADGVAGSGTTIFSNFAAPAAPACAGAIGGTASASVTNACPSQSFSITVSGYTLGTGISIQWQESPAGAGTWTNITGGAGASYTVPSQTAATDYRAEVTCANGGAIDYSSLISVGVNSFAGCYCSPLTGTTLHTYSYNYMDNVTIQTTTLNSSNPSEGPGGYLQLDPNTASNTANLTQLASYNMDVTMIGSGYDAQVWIDYDQSGTFDASEFTSLSVSGSNNLSSGLITIPLSAVPGQTGMRVRTNYFSFGSGDACYDPYFDGETEDYTITIDAAVPCGGTPAPGTASGPAGACAGMPFNLQLTGATNGIGITVDWEESPLGANTWTPVAGGSGTYFSYPGITSSMDFRAVVTCANGGGVDYSNVISVTLNPFYACYCSPLTGTTLHTYYYNYVDNFAIPTTSLSSANPSPGPGGYVQLDPNIASNTASLTQLANYTLEATMTGSGYNAQVWIDYDQSGTFDATEFTDLSMSGSNNISSGIVSIPISAMTGPTGMRVRANYFPFGATDACYDPYYDGETEDYVINIDAAVACTGTPVPGTASGPASVCGGSPFNLLLSGSTTGIGIDVQWQESPAGTNTWTNIPGAISTIYSNPGITSNMDYRAVVTCANGGGVDFSNEITVTVNPFYLCYCSPLTGTTLHTYSYNYIDNVTMPSTTLNSSNPSTVSSGYIQLDQNVASNTATLTQGVAYPINTTMIGTGYTAEVWIDYDQSGTFDVSEFTALSSSSGSPDPKEK